MSFAAWLKKLGIDCASYLNQIPVSTRHTHRSHQALSLAAPAMSACFYWVPFMLHRLGIEVLGLDVLSDTRCAHYRSPRDIIAIKFRCCDRFYACYECHESMADHRAEPWPEAEFAERAILCGACGCLLTISEYLGCNSRCPECEAAFNPGCANHYELYFQKPLS